MSFNSSLLSEKVNLLAGATKLNAKRKGKLVYEKGQPVFGTDSTFQILANVQPVIGRELLQVPEGERDRQHFFVFTRDKLCAEDIVTWCGCDHEVRVVESWGPYYKARMALIDVG